MSNSVSEEINIKAAAAAEAIYRLSEPAYFDPGLKLELRKSAGEIISRVAGLHFFVSRGERREEFFESLLAEVAGITELISFAEDMKMIAEGNGGKVIAAYGRIRDWALQKTSLGDSSSELGGEGEKDSESSAPAKYNNFIPPPSKTPYGLAAGLNGVPKFFPEDIEPREKVGGFVSPDTAKEEGNHAVKDKTSSEDAESLYDEELDPITPTSQENGSEPNINSRQLKIMGFLKGQGQAQIGDIRVLFGDDMSEKTLQRDLWQLVSYGLISREGENRWTTYIYLGHSLGH